MKLFALSLAFVYLLLISSLANASAISHDIGKDALINLVENIPYKVGNPPSNDDTNGTAENQSFSIAIPARNLSGDSAWDFLTLKVMSNATEGTMVSEVSAIRGSDGSLLWQKRYEDAIAYAFPVYDLNGDDRSDIVVDVVLAGMTFIPYSELLVLDGRNGTEIWSKPNILAATIAYPLNKTDLLVHIFSIDPMNKSAVTKISSILAANGTEIDSKTFQGAIAVEYPAKNLTGNASADSIIAAYNIDERNSSVSTHISALSGLNHSTLWNKTFNDMAIAIPNEDVTGDGLSDIVIYELHSDENSTDTSIALLRGTDGKVLWNRLYNGSIAVASTVPDLTGDGIKDFIICKFDGSGKEPVSFEAVKGDDGSLLWSRPSMILLPQ
ncbi:MAG: hypothetical protein WB392_13925 [Methanotrichaceae archaeon]